jgi:predicted Fe-Mo cluster-binding NifX family protein
MPTWIFKPFHLRLRPKQQRIMSMPKIAITCEAPTLDAPLDPRFGRAAGFLLVDSQTTAVEYLDNGASQTMGQGAGIQAAEIVARAGAKVVLTGLVGPKAFAALAAAGIQVVQNLENLTARQALERFQAGNVTYAEMPGQTRRGR